jgi:hypothetical protein
MLMIEILNIGGYYVCCVSFLGSLVSILTSKTIFIVFVG